MATKVIGQVWVPVYMKIEEFRSQSRTSQWFHREKGKTYRLRLGLRRRCELLELDEITGKNVHSEDALTTCNHRKQVMDKVAECGAIKPEVYCEDFRTGTFYLNAEDLTEPGVCLGIPNQDERQWRNQYFLGLSRMNKQAIDDDDPSKSNLIFDLFKAGNSDKLNMNTVFELIPNDWCYYTYPMDSIAYHQIYRVGAIQFRGTMQIILEELRDVEAITAT